MPVEFIATLVVTAVSATWVLASQLGGIKAELKTIGDALITQAKRSEQHEARIVRLEDRRGPRR